MYNECSPNQALFFLLVTGKKSLCLYLNPQHFLLTFFLRGKYLFLSGKSDTALPAGPCSALCSSRCSLHTFSGLSCLAESTFLTLITHSTSGRGKVIHMGWQGDRDKPPPVPAMVLEREHQSEQPSLSHCSCNPILGWFHGRSSFLHHFLFLEAIIPAPHSKRIFFPSLAAWGKFGCQGRTEAPSCRAQPVTKGCEVLLPGCQYRRILLCVYPSLPPLLKHGAHREHPLILKTQKFGTTKTVEIF